MEKTEHYTFGDTDLAAERLRRLAEVYEPSSAALLERVATGHAPHLALDLGCGPGHTTRLVAERTRAERVIGIDQSERLLTQARASAASHVSFTQADLSAPPLPVPGADFLYSRFLLTHLRDPNAVLRGLAGSAVPGAWLVLEETAILSSEDVIFSAYYEFVARLQAHYGQRMYIGLELDELCRCPEWKGEESLLLEVRLPAADMARLHFLNIQTWSSDPFAVAHFPAEELLRVREGLSRVAAGEVSAPPVTCGMKQLVLRRR